MINAQAITVGINAQPAKKGADEVTLALRSIERSLQSVKKVLEEVNKTAGKGAGGGGGGDVTGDIARKVPEANSALLSFMQTLNKIRNTLFVMYLLREAFEGLTSALRAVISAGIEFNAIMEQAVIGTGGLIAQIGSLEKQHIKLEGVEAIRAGMELAKEEVLALQIAGLQTAATSTALVNAFQQAVGPGLAAGLALKQVRDLTVDIVQVATAIGLPMHQIAQEVRAIVEGTIDPNARVAKVLQIDNATIQKMKEAGKLAEFLTEKLNKFREIGPIIEKSWQGVISNMQEFGEVLSGLVTQPLFDKLRDSLLNLQTQLREGGAGKDATELKDLFAPDIVAGVENIQKAFDELGTQADRVLLTILDRARDMLEVFGETDKVENLQDAIRRLGDILVDTINRADVKTWLRDMVTGFNDLTKAFKEVDEFANKVSRALKFLEGVIHVLLTPLGILLALMQRPQPGQTTADWIKNAFDTVRASLQGAYKQIDDAMKGTDFTNEMETGAERVGKNMGDATKRINEATHATVRLKNEFAHLFATDQPNQWTALFDIGATKIRTQRFEVDERAKVNPPPPPPKVDKNAASKAKREAEKQAAIERAFQLAKLQLYEQTARDAIGLQDEMNKILLKQNEEAYEREIISLDEFEKKRRALLMKGAAGEREIALVRIKGAALAGAKALSEIMTLPNFREALEAANYEDVLRFIEELKKKDATVQTQEQAEALREMTQAATDLASALLRVKVARGDFELDKLPVIKRRQEPVPLAISETAAQIAMSANLRQEREKILALEQEAVDIQKALTLGYITQAEALERQADNEERMNQLAIDRLASEIRVLDTVIDADKIHEKTLEKMERLAKVFRISNAAAFFKGLNENLEKLSEKFERLGQDLRSTFRDAFEELGRTGFRGFADTFLAGIADMLNTRAADALSQIVGKIFTDIFKTGGGGQSIFDKMLEQLLRVFGRAPTGKFSIGGIFEKIFGKLLDPLGRKKDLPIAGLPKGPTGLPTILEDIARTTPDERTQALLTSVGTDVSGIYRETIDIARSLHELKQCCAEHNNLLKQQMANAPKAPGLLQSLLGAAVGAAAGGFAGAYTGKIFEGGGTLTGYPGSEGDLPYPIPSNPKLPLPAPPPMIPPWAESNLARTMTPVTTNITIVTPNPAAFNAPQTQAQIGSLMLSSMQKAQNMVPAINSNAFNK